MNQEGLLGVVERLLAGAAVLGATIYVLLNALYLEYYDEFGLRPEEVGIDRLAVLGRAAWVAIFGMGLGSLILFFAVTRRSDIERARRDVPRDATTDQERELAKQFAQRLKTSIQDQSRKLRSWTAALVIVMTVALLSTFFALNAKVDGMADDARDGTRVRGIGWLSEFVDVRATPAEIAWVSDSDMPTGLSESATYMYLGRGDNLLALLTCEGRTLLVGTTDVQVTVLGSREGEADDAGWPPDAKDCPD